MTKRIVMLCAMLCCAFSFARAQETEEAAKTSGAAKTWDNTRTFLSGLDYTISVGFGTCSANEPYSDGLVPFIFGIDGRKVIKSYLDDKVDIYGAAGLHFSKKGGKIAGARDDGFRLTAIDRFRISQLLIPVRAGGLYNFKKWQAFVDLGPYFAFAVKKTHSEDVKPKGVNIGFCWNLGLKFKKRFGISLGMEHSFMNIADCTISKRNQVDGWSIGDKVTLKADPTLNIRFQWTFDNWKFGKKNK